MPKLHVSSTWQSLKDAVPVTENVPTTKPTLPCFWAFRRVEPVKVTFSTARFAAVTLLISIPRFPPVGRTTFASFTTMLLIAMSPMMVPKSGASRLSILCPCPSSVPEKPSTVVHPVQSMSAPSSTVSPDVARAAARSAAVETPTAKPQEEQRIRVIAKASLNNFMANSPIDLLAF